MRERMVLCGILTKRLLCKKSFWVILCLLLLCMIGVRELEKGSETTVQVAVCAENDSAWKEALKKETGLIQFYFCDSVEQLKRDVVTGSAECGYVLTEDLQKKVEEDDWYWSIEVYESSQSMLTRTINETVFSRIFYVISSEWYAGYIAEKADLETAEEVENKGVILEVLRSSMGDGSTFSVVTEYVDRNALPAYGQGGAGQQTDMQPEKEPQAGNRGVFPVRGVAAAGIFLCGLLGAGDVLRDKRKGYFIGKPRIWTGAFTIGLPVFFAAVGAYIALWVTATDRGVVRELFLLGGYVLLVTVYALVLQWIVRKEHLLAGMIPFLFLGSLVCAPVFIDLGSIFPVFGILENLFPATWYLRGF